MCDSKDLNFELGRILAAACCCSLSIGWLIGKYSAAQSDTQTQQAAYLTKCAAQHLVSALCSLAGIWGGITAMPSFSAVIFPTHSLNSKSNSNDTYCMYNDQLISFTGSVIYLAALPALAVAARTTHKYGRKPTMWAIVVLLVTGAAVGAAADNLAAVFSSRALMGMAMGCRYVTGS